MDCSGFNCLNTRTCVDLMVDLEPLTVSVGRKNNTNSYTIPPYGYLESFEDETGNQCQVAVSYVVDSVEGRYNGILGAAFLRNYFVEFDFAKSLVSLAANNGNSWNGGAGYTSKGYSVDPNNSGGDPNIVPDDNGADEGMSGAVAATITIGSVALLGAGIYSFLKCRSKPDLDVDNQTLIYE